MSTSSGSASGSSPCSRDRSMIWATRSLSRADSTPIRPANLRTALGSSAASSTASASSEIAPIGVFSSWLTLATKSRRVVSTRRSAVRSSARTTISSSVSGATRGAEERARLGRAAGDLQLHVAHLGIPSIRTDRTKVSSSGTATRLPRARPRVRASVVASNTSSCGPTTTPTELSTPHQCVGAVRDDGRGVLEGQGRLAGGTTQRQPGQQGTDDQAEHESQGGPDRVHSAIVEATDPASARVSTRQALVHPPFRTRSHPVHRGRGSL